MVILKRRNNGIPFGPAIGLVIVLAVSASMARADDPQGTAELKKLSVDELLATEVTSVSRRPQTLLEAPAAIEVITGEDIRRSGASTIAEALRLANSLDVAQKNSHEWVISARGFSSDVGNKLLVLSDGRSVYTPLFSGVFWDRQDYVLDDIERIEIVSGPGGALWGANAVNGVINITTKSAAQTQGLYLDAGAGTDPQSFAALRYGGQLSPGVSYRLYGKYAGRDREELQNGSDAHDLWHAGQGGFRLDATDTARGNFTLQGDFYHNREQIQTGGESTVSGGNVLGRWSQDYSATAGMSLQVYYDRTHLILPTPPLIFAPAGVFKDDLGTADVDFQHHFQWGGRSRILLGLGYRYTDDLVHNAPALAFFPQALRQNLYSGFVQDEIAAGDELTVTLGTKVEHTDYTGFEWEPSVRLQWNFAPRQSLWAAASRAVRTPSRIDHDLSEPSPGYLIVILKGGADFRSETLRAYELGYRGQLTSRLGAAVSLFYNDYDDLRSTSLSAPDPVFGLPFPFFFANNLAAATYGLELSADYQPLPRWRLRGEYRLLEEDVRIKPGQADFNNALNETADPQQQLALRSSLDLRSNLELDSGLRWVDNRRINNAGVPALIPSYMELNLRLGWRPTRAVEFSLSAQNLLHDRHPEYGVPGATQIQIERSVWGRATCRF